jgi:hypothetical protein
MCSSILIFCSHHQNSKLLDPINHCRANNHKNPVDCVMQTKMQVLMNVKNLGEQIKCLQIGIEFLQKCFHI